MTPAGATDEPAEREREMTPTTGAPHAPPADGRAAAPIGAFGKARSTVPGSPLSADEVRRVDAF